MNTTQYATKISESHLAPFTYNLPGNPEDYQTVEGGLRVHTAKLCQEYRKEYGITRMDRLPSSPDLNPIENAWGLLKVRQRKRQQDPSKRFNTEEEFIQAAQEELEKLDWAAVDKSIDSMNKRVQHVLKKHEGHTKF
jgi:transposase